MNNDYKFDLEVCHHKINLTLNEDENQTPWVSSISLQSNGKSFKHNFLSKASIEENGKTQYFFELHKNTVYCVCESGFREYWIYSSNGDREILTEQRARNILKKKKDAQ